MQVAVLALVTGSAGILAGPVAAQAGSSTDCVTERARRLHDFGGVYLDGTAVHVRVADASPERLRIVESELRTACPGAPVIVAERSEYTAAELQRFVALARDALSIDGVSFLGADERTGTVSVAVSDPAAVDRVRSHLAAQGIPADAVTISEASPVRPAERDDHDRGAPLAIGALAAVAVAIGLAGVALRRRAASPPAPSTPHQNAASP